MWERATRASRSRNVPAISKHCCARRRYSSALLATTRGPRCTICDKRSRRRVVPDARKRCSGAATTGRRVGALTLDMRVVSVKERPRPADTGLEVDPYEAREVSGLTHKSINSVSETLASPGCGFVACLVLAHGLPLTMRLTGPSNRAGPARWGSF